MTCNQAKIRMDLFKLKKKKTKRKKKKRTVLASKYTAGKLEFGFLSAKSTFSKIFGQLLINCKQRFIFILIHKTLM